MQQSASRHRIRTNRNEHGHPRGHGTLRASLAGMLAARVRGICSAGGAAFLGFALLTGLVALAGGRATRRRLSPWYEELKKPPFQPPAWLFAPVWTVLYGLIATSGWRIYRSSPGIERKQALRLWTGQLVLNGLWSELFFGKGWPRAALADSMCLLGVVTTYMRVARRVDEAAGTLFVPYAGWLAFATVLNAEIVRRNPRVVVKTRRQNARPMSN